MPGEIQIGYLENIFTRRWSSTGKYSPGKWFMALSLPVSVWEEFPLSITFRLCYVELGIQSNYYGWSQHIWWYDEVSSELKRKMNEKKNHQCGEIGV